MRSRRTRREAHRRRRITGTAGFDGGDEESRLKVHVSELLQRRFYDGDRWRMRGRSWRRRAPSFSGLNMRRIGATGGDERWVAYSSVLDRYMATTGWWEDQWCTTAWPRRAPEWRIDRTRSVTLRSKLVAALSYERKWRRPWACEWIMMWLAAQLPKWSNIRWAQLDDVTCFKILGTRY
jgi:hypothetical protein